MSSDRADGRPAAERPRVVAHQEGWTLPLAGRSVSGLLLSDAVALRCVDSSGTVHLELDGPFVIRTSSGDEEHVVPDAGPEGLVGALSLMFRAIVGAEVDKAGRLVVEFADGGSIVLDAEEHFHSWRLHDEVGMLMVSMPEHYAAIERRS